MVGIRKGDTQSTRGLVYCYKSLLVQRVNCWLTQLVIKCLDKSHLQLMNNNNIGDLERSRGSELYKAILINKLDDVIWRANGGGGGGCDWC